MKRNIAGFANYAMFVSFNICGIKKWLSKAIVDIIFALIMKPRQNLMDLK